MGLRFQRRITIFPGVSLNLSNGSPSISLGPQGASLTIGKNGTYANLGLPGTGLSYRTRLDAAKSGKTPKTATGAVDVAALADAVSSLNLEMEALLNIHLQTPDPKQGAIHAKLQAQYDQYRNGVFTIPAPMRPSAPQLPSQPVAPVKEEAGFFSRLFGGTENLDAKYEADLARWKVEQLHWERACEALTTAFEQDQASFDARYAQWEQAQAAARQRTGEGPENYEASPDFMEAILASAFSGIAWPQETSASFQFSGTKVLVDVDLPEIENFPNELASLAAKKTEIVFKKKSEKQQRLDYARYVHGCLLRVAGEVFARLPAISDVVVSGYTQTISKKTGFAEDTYLLSCKIPRSQFSKLNFSNLAQVDPVEALVAFENRRSMSATGIFKVIVPFDDSL